jgi:hypothetical protein
MSIDLGNTPVGTPPTEEEKTQIKAALGIELFSQSLLTLADAGAWRGALDADAKVVYGSNANGEFWRWESGLQICLGEGQSLSTTQSQGSFYISSTAPTWTYPAEFVTAPWAFGTQYVSTVMWINMAPESAMSWYRLWSTLSSPSLVPIKLTAIGIWF